MRVISAIKSFFAIECDVVRESAEIALNDAIERVHTMQLEYEVEIEMQHARNAQERYNELAN